MVPGYYRCVQDAEYILSNCLASIIYVPPKYQINRSFYRAKFVFSRQIDICKNNTVL